MRIGFIGLGRVARALAIGLSRAGHIISPSFDIDKSPASRWEAELQFCSAESLEQAVGAAELLFITTPDDAIPRVVQSISCLPSPVNLLAVFHTSGATAASILSPIGERGVDFASTHPVMTFSGAPADADMIKNSTFCIEAGTEAGIRMASEVSTQLGARVVELSGESKLAHHLACVIASNFLVVLLNEAHSVHEAAGVPSDLGLEMLTHLAKAAAQNVRSQGPMASLTGPFARGDTSSIEAHIEWMNKCSPALLELYTMLGRRAIQLALAANQISQDTASKVLELLKV